MAAVRHGSRWLHEAPTEDEVKEWFQNQPLHPGMTHGPYLGGIVLISATEKFKVSREKQNGDTYTVEMEQAVYVPYIKVDTRIAYFRDYVRALNQGTEHGDFLGVIEPVQQRRITDASSAYYNEHLPEGFSIYPVRNKDGSINRYLVCTMRVAIYERQSYARQVAGEPIAPVLQGVGSKQTIMAKNWGDDNAVMKAETGAVGRALGVAGILVVGTGVATAEDVQEAMAGPSGAAGSSAEGAVLPTDESAPGADVGGGVEAEQPEAAMPQTDEEKREALVTHALALQQEMERDHPELWAAYKSWWSERQFGAIRELPLAALNGAVVKLERDLDAAKQQA